MNPRIYLDNAATSWPKPEAVYAAVDRYQRQCGAAVGRSPYSEANDAWQTVNETRRLAAQLLRVADSRRVIFTLNGTDALNQAIHGLLRPGDHVVTTVCEHNSVLRPLHAAQSQQRIDVTFVGERTQGIITVDEVLQALRPETRLVAMIHASNVTGRLLPVAEIAAAVRERAQNRVFFLVDAAQSLGHVPLDWGSLAVDLVAAPGHKGCLGPLGTGLLYVAPGVEEHLPTTRQGGTGSHSEDEQQPTELPDRYEAGNLNAPGIIGLGAGLLHLSRTGLAVVRQHELQMTARLVAGLRRLPGLTLIGHEDPQGHVGVVSLRLAGYEPHEVAASLDAVWSIQTRPGLHCAPRMHAALGTLATGGTVRLSLGPFTTSDEIDQTLDALGQLAVAQET